MKKFILIVLFVALLSIPVLAETETIVSVSCGMSTGLMGFTFEKLFDKTSYNLGIGMTPDGLRTSAAVRQYLPDFKSGAPKSRSNVYFSPQAGIIWDWMDPGYKARFWGGLTGGYDHRWGQYKQYRLTVEGGFGLTQDQTNPHTSIMNVSLGYVF